MYNLACFKRKWLTARHQSPGATASCRCTWTAPPARRPWPCPLRPSCHRETGRRCCWLLICWSPTAPAQRARQMEFLILKRFWAPDATTCNTDGGIFDEILSFFLFKSLELSFGACHASLASSHRRRVIGALKLHTEAKGRLSWHPWGSRKMATTKRAVRLIESAMMCGTVQYKPQKQ